MTLPDSNTIIRAYLADAVANPALAALVGSRIYCPRLPENATLPAIGFFTRGGTSTPYIPDLPTPSVQFDCWASNPIMARHVYKTLYDALQGKQNIAVIIPADILQDGIVILPAGTYYILSAIEEVQGQDLVDIEIQNYFRTLCFFSIMVR